MSNKRNKSGGIKKAVGTLAALLVFALPFLFTAQWVYRMANGGDDPRKEFTSSQVAAFRTGDCGAAQLQGQVQPFSEPIVTVTMDDGWETVYSQAFRVLEKCNIKTTQYILGGYFDDPLYLSEAQVRSMQAAGHEIAAHTMTHPDLTSLSEAELEREVAESNKVLDKKFGTVRDFATPLGASNDMVLQHIQRYYRSSRNTIGDPATLEDHDLNLAASFNRYDINAYTVRQSTTLHDIQKLIDFAKQRNGWLVITYHQIDGNNPGEYAVSPQTLEAQIKLIRDSKIRTATMGEVLDAIQARD